MKALGRLLLFASLVAGLFYFLGNTSLTHAEDDSGTVPLQAEVLESESSPTVSPTPQKVPSMSPGSQTPESPGTETGNSPGGESPTTAPPSGSQPGSGSGGDDGPGDEPDSEPTGGTTSGEASVDGIVYVGALSARYQWSINPSGGSLALSVPIRNASPDPVNAVAVFSVKNFLGGQVGSNSVKLVVGLEPEETRIITATIQGLAQWTLVSSQVTVSRLGDKDAWGLGSVTRDCSVFFFPWFVALMVATLVGGTWWWWRRRRNQALMRADQPGREIHEPGIAEDDMDAVETDLQ